MSVSAASFYTGVSQQEMTLEEKNKLLMRQLKEAQDLIAKREKTQAAPKSKFNEKVQKSAKIWLLIF